MARLLVKNVHVQLASLLSIVEKLGPDMIPNSLPLNMPIFCAALSAQRLVRLLHLLERAMDQKSKPLKREKPDTPSDPAAGIVE